MQESAMRVVMLGYVSCAPQLGNTWIIAILAARVGDLTLLWEPVTKGKQGSRSGKFQSPSPLSSFPQVLIIPLIHDAWPQQLLTMRMCFAHLACVWGAIPCCPVWWHLAGVIVCWQR